MFASVPVEYLWLAAGFLAQALVSGCLIVHVIASKRAGRFALPPACIYVCIFAIAVLALYAAATHEPVFLVGQILNLLIALRVLAFSSTQSDDAKSEFPVVAPDRADADADRHHRAPH